ncbi:hypothetical protein [Aurantimonas coralicida]|uniref:hypothetical protein n=1 Tax=Aurantimonas coralicida TaxID=182270 RepID=UPI001E36701C|nr:hypothetical protein [Aurantimonas coralicida]MCD1642461.1 hypothetical protein [Aurantimonas coralicida]
MTDTTNLPSAANDNVQIATSVCHGTPKAPSCPTTRAKARDRAQAARDAERARMAPVLAAIRTRQAIGDPACPANQNEDFPLLATLRRAANHDAIATLRRYRRLVAIVGAQPLQGVSFQSGDDGAVEHRTDPLDNGELEKAAANGWRTRSGLALQQVPGGDIRHRPEVKRGKGAYPLPGRRAVAVNVEKYDRPAEEYTPVTGFGSLARPFNDSLLMAQIDARPVLGELRASLGPLLDDFEDAVLGGKTLGQIGTAHGIGIGSKPEGAGRALVFKALATIEATWRDIDRRAHAAARQAEAKALARRDELAAARADYLGVAA